MRYLLDSNIVIIALLGDDATLRRHMSEANEDDFGMSSIVYAEVALGSVKGKPPSFQLLSRVVARVPVLPFDFAAARAYATLPFRRKSYDRLIAAHALSSGLILVTDNESDFADVPGLKVENWTR
jgi:tRNA(fMet)-specific endonuclease VapC